MTITDFKVLFHSKIETNSKLMMQQICRWRNREYPVVFVHGIFDELNGAQLDRLAEIASSGARLITAVRSDESMQRFQNRHTRKSQQDRAMILAAMTFVSMVVFLDDETPEKLIEQIRPDIVAEFRERYSNTSGGAN